MDRTYLSGIERGVRNPSLANILRIAASLDVTPVELFAYAQHQLLTAKDGRKEGSGEARRAQRPSPRRTAPSPRAAGR